LHSTTWQTPFHRHRRTTLIAPAGRSAHSLATVAQFPRRPVERVDLFEQQVAIRFDDRMVKYDFDDLDEVSLAWRFGVSWQS